MVSKRLIQDIIDRHQRIAAVLRQHEHDEQSYSSQRYFAGAATGYEQAAADLECLLKTEARIAKLQEAGK